MADLLVLHAAGQSTSVDEFISYQSTLASDASTVEQNNMDCTDGLAVCINEALSQQLEAASPVTVVSEMWGKGNMILNPARFEQWGMRLAGAMGMDLG